MAIEKTQLIMAVAELLSTVDIPTTSTEEVTLPAVFDLEENAEVDRKLVTTIYQNYKTAFVAAENFEQFKNVIDKVILEQSLSLSDAVLVAKVANLLRSVEGLPPL